MDPIVDKYGNRHCGVCGATYGKACQNCCKHEHLHIIWDYCQGGLPTCKNCLKEFTGSDFDCRYTIVKQVRED